MLVDEYAACLRFYRDTLGFEVAWGDEDSGYADLRIEGATVALVFAVESVDDAYARLEADVGFLTDPHDRPEWGIRVAYLRDPDGTLVEINEPLDER